MKAKVIQNKGFWMVPESQSAHKSSGISVKKRSLSEAFHSVPKNRFGDHFDVYSKIGVV